MVSTRDGDWTTRGVTFLLWAGAAASVVAWGLKLGTGPSPAPTTAAGLQQPPAVDPAAVARLLGHVAGAPAAPVAAAAPSAASRFSLLGVVAGASRQGAALIAVDGRPPKPYRVGSLVDEGLVLQAVQPRRALLGASADGPATLTLELPAAPR